MNIRRKHLMMELGEAKFRLVHAERRQERTGATEDMVARLSAKFDLDLKIEYVIKEMRDL